MRLFTEPPTRELLFRETRDVDVELENSLKSWGKLPVNGAWLVNSHPKSGTHLLRNILLHFNSAVVHHTMLFYDTFVVALNGSTKSSIHVGHIPYSLFFEAAPYTSEPCTILLLRHPCAILLALARSFYDVNTKRPDHLKMRERQSFAEIVKDVACGYARAGQRFAPLSDSLAEFGTEWLGNVEFTVKFEDMIARLASPPLASPRLASPRLASPRLTSNDRNLVDFFAPMLRAVFGDVPADAAARLRAGACSGISATYSRTQDWARQERTPEQVYDLLPAAAADALREAAYRFGY
ncbi:MAG TPA: hypothetical protein VHY35_22830 [Stellaceae bacterium]|jgi:hypothetical protein|nr:hypothetical protein [Stellaceae bacterium]